MFVCVRAVVYCKVRYVTYNDKYQMSEGNIFIVNKDL